MTKIVGMDLPAPEINPDKVGFIIMKTREMEAGDPGWRQDASNASDDEFVSALGDDAFVTNRQEVAEFIDALDEDESFELVALAWIGRGDFTARELSSAIEEARGRREMKTSAYLLGLPMLPDYLADGLAAFDLGWTDILADRI